jgi:Holliday junction DNA helicase RuvA
LIGSIRGVALERWGERLLVDCGGVGYILNMTSRDLAALRLGEEAFIYVSTQVKDASIELYGFLDRRCRESFQALLGVHGVGPSLALSLLNSFGLEELAQVIEEGAPEVLCMVPGIGPKTAARLVLELKGRLERFGDGYLPSWSEARAVLAALGYGEGEIREALAGLDAAAGTEEVVRSALRRLGGSSGAD